MSFDSQIKTRIDNEIYLRSHPEVEILISDFLRLVSSCSLILKKTKKVNCHITLLTVSTSYARHENEKNTPDDCRK